MEKKRISKKGIVRLLILALVLVFLVLGIWDGQIKRVYTKARFICYECIGIG